MHTNFAILFRCGLGVIALWSCNPPFKAGASALPRLNIQTNPVSREATALSGFAPVVKQVAPSVVTIYSTKMVREDYRNPLLNDPFFRRFFGQDEEEEMPRNRRRGRPHQEQGIGSGVIVSSDGYILSNNHVVEDADEVTVGFVEGGNRLKAKVIGTDPQTDISVLKIQTTNLTPVAIADSTKLQVGDLVLAVGNPFGVGQTVTMGIVSAVGRGGFGIVDYEDFIQTDASINPGNSGGALVDAQGRLVGINTAIVSGGGGNVGIGFSVPINMARMVMERIVQEGKVVRGYLGVYIQPITPELAREFNVAAEAGALVGGVSPDGPAAKAGIQPGDVITEFNGTKVTDSRNLRLMVAQSKPGTKASFKLLHNGKEKTVTTTLGELPTEKLASAGAPGRPSARQPEGLAGVEVSDLDAKIRRQMNLPPDMRGGAVVTGIEADSPAYEAGLRVGDIILEINRQKVSSARDVVEISRKIKGNRALLRVSSRAGSRFIVIEPEPTSDKDKE
ncbi:MAG TPA: Do family serine endopeptidase [Candidatus Binatia bacterium]|nr:Do family serine endopeptidase [Candidatus Binatia bacterium]